MKKYFSYKVKKMVSVQDIFTLEYLELKPNYKYNDEIHDFWELIYVDNGKIICDFEKASQIIDEDEIMLVPPYTHHSYRADNVIAPSIFIMCFKSTASSLKLLKDKIKLSPDLKKLLLYIMSEAKDTFVFPFQTKLRLINNPNPGGQQLIENYLEELLIKLVRIELYSTNEIHFFMSSMEFENKIVNEIITFLKDNIYGKISLEEISKRLFYSKTYINSIFKNNMKSTVMHYYILLKINEAKKLIREQVAIKDISEKLCFDTPNYFSKVFQKFIGKTPSEYKKGLS